MAGAVLNREGKTELLRHGREQQPILVIDDMLADPEVWREEAARRHFRQIGPHYPGLRAPVAETIATAMRDELEPLLAETFELNPVPPLLECYFSIVTTPPNALAPIQRLPHVDGLERDRIAILIFLSGVEAGGTAFYRQRSTGFETLDRERFPRFEAELRAGVAQHGLPEAAYISGNTPLYERIASYEARPNRALIYRSRSLHCAEIAPNASLAADPLRGRLTINSFLFDPHRP